MGAWNVQRHLQWRACILNVVFFMMLLIAGAEDIADDPCEGLGAEMCPEKAFNPNYSASFVSPEPHAPPQQGQRHVTEIELGKLISNQQKQVERMEGLIKHLDSSVRMLRDVLSVTENVRVSEDIDNDHRDVERSKHTSSAFSEGKEEAGSEILPKQESAHIRQLRESEKTKAQRVRTVARYKPAWSEHFQFLSAVRVDAPLSCLHILPHEGEDGLSKYVAVGDETGHLYIFSSHGDLLVDHASLCTAPVTVMISLILRRNETLLVTGHSNGAVLAHRVWETPHRGASSADDWTSLTMEYSHSFLPAAPSAQAGVGGITQGNAVVNLEMYRVGRMRYLLVADRSGKLQVFRDNGSLYGSAESPSMPLAFLKTSNTQRLLFLTTNGAASLDLRSMTVRSSPCEGLNNSSLVAYAFDAAGRSKAYGVTEDGDLVYVALSGDTSHFDCHARAKRKLEVDGPVKLHGLKGYILIATPREVAVYNTTLQMGFSYSNNIRVGGPRSLFTSSMDEISLAFVNTPVAPGKQPLIVCDRDKLVVLGFGDGYVGIFKSNLPVYRPNDMSAKLWGGPVVVSILVMSLAWYFFSRRKDHPAMATPNSGAEVVPGLVSPAGAAGAAGLRKYDKVRPGLAENREGLGDDPRRYGSPSRVYGAGGASPGGYGVGTLSYRNTGVQDYGNIRGR